MKIAHFVACCSSTIVAGSATFAHAETATLVETEAQSGQIEEIIVTAQRREERLQDVPVSVTAISAESLKASGVNRIYDLNKVDPSVNISIGQGPVEPVIRGSGSILDAAGNEGSAAVYIDGVYIARPMPEMFSFEQDIVRVEVLKGPQGTLFGRNSSAGLINIVTRTPTPGSPLDVEGTIGYGNYNTRDVSGYISSGLGARAALDLSAYYNDQIGGWGQNLVLGTKVGYGWRQGVRSKFVAEFTDTTKLTISGDYVRSATNRPFGTLPGTTAGNPLYGIIPGSPPAVIPSAGYYDSQTNYPYHWTTKSYSSAVRLDQALPFANFVSISGYRRTEMDFHDAGNSLPFNGLNEFTYQLEENARQFSQEFQLLSKPGSKVTWVAGLYYLDSRDGYNPTAFQGLEFGPGVNVNLVGITEVKSYAGFAQGTIEVAPKLNATLGLRDTIDHSSLFGFTAISTIGPNSDAPYLGGTQLLRLPDVIGSATWKKVTWRGALDYKLTDDALLYGSVSRGFKGGEFGTLPAVATPINPETTDAYELGFKSEYLNRTVLVNGALFWNEIKNPQVDYIRNQNVLLVNAQSARVRGAEVQLGWRATEYLQLRFSGTALDPRYTGYENVPYNSPSSKLVNGIVPGCTTPATYTPAAGYPKIPISPLQGGNVDFCSGNGTGNYLPRASKFAGTAGFDYIIPVGNDKIVISPNLAYNSGFFWLPDNTLAQKPLYLLDGQLKYVIGEGKVQIRAWGRNLTNKQYSVNAYEEGEGAGYVQQPAPPRTFGINLDAKL